MADSGVAYRPDDSLGGLPPADAVQAISVCRYIRHGNSSPSRPPILSSTRITGEHARLLINAIQAAPHGQGPNNPDAATAGPDIDYGEEIMVLRIHLRDATREVVVRYSGDYANGVDDGVVHRQLTSEIVGQLLTGPHEPNTLTVEVAKLLPVPR